MRLEIIATAAACAFALALPFSAAAAADAKKKKGASTSASKSSKSKPSGKSKSRQPVAKRRDSSSEREPQLVQLASPPEIPLTPAQLELAQRVQTGVADCEFEQSVLIEPHARRPGAFHVKYRKTVYEMVPEETSTGAVRLADPHAGVVWLQIPVKSMLMNTRLGQRMVDACTSPNQRLEQALAAAAAQHGSQAAASSLGIDPARVVLPVSVAGPAAAIDAGMLRQASSLPLPVVSAPAAAVGLQDATAVGNASLTAQPAASASIVPIVTAATATAPAPAEVPAAPPAAPLPPPMASN